VPQHDALQIARRRRSSLPQLQPSRQPHGARSSLPAPAIHARRNPQPSASREEAARLTAIALTSLPQPDPMEPRKPPPAGIPARTRTRTRVSARSSRRPSSSPASRPTRRSAARGGARATLAAQGRSAASSGRMLETSREQVSALPAARTSLRPPLTSSGRSRRLYGFRCASKNARMRRRASRADSSW